MEKLKELTVQAYCIVASGSLVVIDVPEIFRDYQWESVPDSRNEAGSYFQEVWTTKVPLYLIERLSESEREHFWYD